MKFMLFSLSVIVLMSVIQTYRLARLIKDTEGEGYRIKTTMFVMLFIPGETGWRLVAYYLALMLGKFQTGYKKVCEEEEILKHLPSEGCVGQYGHSDKMPLVMDKFIQLNIIIPFARLTSNSREFRKACEALLEGLNREDDGNTPQRFILTIEARMDRFGDMNDISREEIMNMLTDYLTNLDDQYINNKIKENQL